VSAKHLKDSGGWAKKGQLGKRYHRGCRRVRMWKALRFRPNRFQSPACLVPQAAGHQDRLGPGCSLSNGVTTITGEWNWNSHGQIMRQKRGQKTRMHTAEKLDLILDDGMKIIQIKVLIHPTIFMMNLCWNFLLYLKLFLTFGETTFFSTLLAFWGGTRRASNECPVLRATETAVSSSLGMVMERRWVSFSKNKICEVYDMFFLNSVVQKNNFKINSSYFKNTSKQFKIKNTCRRDRCCGRGGGRISAKPEKEPLHLVSAPNSTHPNAVDSSLSRDAVS